MNIVYREATEAEIQKITKIWDMLTIDCHPDIAAAVLDDILTHYSEPHRAYHNIGHLVELFEYWEEHYDEFEDPTSAAFAIFFHDVIYSIPGQDNEEKSALYAAIEMDALGIADGIIDRVQDLVRMTKTHECDENDRDAALFLDMDTAVIGNDCGSYQRYTAAIEEEYCGPYSPQPFPRDQFYQGRFMMFVYPWLQKDRKFKTDLFEQRYGKQAGLNLALESTILRRKIDGGPDLKPV